MLTHKVLRARVPLHTAPVDRFQVRIARTVDDYRGAFRLVRAAYIAHGIESVRDPELRITPQHLMPEATVFVAHEDGQLVGTMTVTLDSPAGLPMDKEYRPELDALRATNTVIAEYGSLAVVQRCRHAGVTTLLNIAADRWANLLLGATHTVAQVHPKAEVIYAAHYNFEALGAAKAYGALGAPTIALVRDVAGWRTFASRHHTQLMASGHSVYDHFLEPSVHLPCVDVPSTRPPCDLARWKMPKPVFRELFMEETDSVASLDEAQRTYLGTVRSRGTLALSGAEQHGVREIAATESSGD
jgi:hypothetical protein